MPGVHEILRTAGKVGEGDVAGVDAELMVERGEDFAKMHAAFDDLAAETIGRADDRHNEPA